MCRAGNSSPSSFLFKVFHVEQTDLSLHPWLLRVTIEVSGITARCPIPSGQTGPKLRSGVVKAGARVLGTSPSLWGTTRFGGSQADTSSCAC